MRQTQHLPARFMRHRSHAAFDDEERSAFRRWVRPMGGGSEMSPTAWNIMQGGATIIFIATVFCATIALAVMIAS